MNKRPLKYKVVFAELQEQIRRGKFDDSHPFPSETQIMRRFNVGRQTAIRVFQELQKSGLVVRKQGAGTFLTPAASWGLSARSGRGSSPGRSICRSATRWWRCMT